MFSKPFFIAALLAASALSNNVQAQTWTVTTTGHIASGFDFSGAFGTAGRDLRRLSYTQSITASVDSTRWDQHYINSFNQGLSGRGPAFTDTVTVDGISVSFTASSSLSGSSQQVLDGLAHGLYPQDRISSIQDGNFGVGYLSATNYAYSFSTPFVPTNDFGLSLSQNTLLSDYGSYARFEVTGTQYVVFNAYPDSITVNVSAVPEPETYGMLFAGLGLLGVMARRKSAGKV